jgi:SAM-dependent methyltransferase
MPEQDYVLGTHDAELARLRLQHEVWRPHVLDAWHRAGIGRGARVVDVGAGPGDATIDLAQIVGATGAVLAVERSERFVAGLRSRAPRNVRVQRADVITDAIDGTGFDAAWCRWVACFVCSPGRLVDRIASSLRRGAVFVSHEYVDYATWRLIPRRPPLESFVAEVMASWRATGGEPDIARLLPDLLRTGGFDVRSVRPLVFAAHPGEPMWRWPAAFARVGGDRLRALGRVDDQWVDGVVNALSAAEREPGSIMLTPLVLEIIATKQ